jgi:hypothetical protein
MEFLAPPSPSGTVVPNQNAPLWNTSLKLGNEVVVNGGRLNGLKGQLVKIQEGRVGVVRLFSNIQLVISLDRLTMELP